MSANDNDRESRLHWNKIEHRDYCELSEQMLDDNRSPCTPDDVTRAVIPSGRFDERLAVIDWLTDTAENSDNIEIANLAAIVRGLISR